MSAPRVEPLPIDRVIVERIDRVLTGHLGVTSYTITAVTVDAEQRRVQYQTIRDLDASACERSMKLKIPVRIRWKASKYHSHDITRIEVER